VAGFRRQAQLRWVLIVHISSHIAADATRRQFLLALGIVLIGANLRAPITSLGPILADIQADLALGDVAAGFLNALPLLIFALLSLFAPAIGRAAGLERGLGGALLAILAGLAIRSSPLSGALWIGTLLISGGIAIGNVLLPALVKREFPDRAAFFIGLYAAAMASTAGLAAGLAAPVAHLSGSGWRVALVMPVAITLCALGVWLPQLRSKRHAVAAGTAGHMGFISPWKHPIAWQISIFFAAHSFVFYSLVSWYAVITQSRGGSAAAAGVDLLLYQVVAVITNLGSAPVIKRMRDQRAIGFICGACLLTGTIGLYCAAPLPVLWLMIAGLGAGFSMTTSLSLFALRSTHHEQAAAVSAMAQFVGYAGAAVGPVLFGLLHETSAGWQYSLATLVAASVLVTASAVLAGRGRVME
jgi:CP family cyanate transporter-like MFS transporter